MHYNIGTADERDTYPKLLINNEEDLKTFDCFRLTPILSFEFVLQTIKEQFEIEEITSEQINELYDTLYEKLYPMVIDAGSEVFSN
jgi:hypothetical protein